MNQHNETIDIFAAFVLIFAAIIGFIVLIFFTLTLVNCLKKVKEENRAMKPGLIWLNLIPIFCWFWIFYIIVKLNVSLEKEFASRNISSSVKGYGYKIGLAWAILMWCSIIPSIGQITTIAGIVCWIIYWIKVSKCSKELDAPEFITENNPPPPSS
jgi:hypothetical protein